MAMDQSALLDLLAELKDTDVSDRIRAATEHLYQELIDAEATAVIGAGPWQRTVDRTAQRNGTRPRTLTTTATPLSTHIHPHPVAGFAVTVRSRTQEALPPRGEKGPLTRRFTG